MRTAIQQRNLSVDAAAICFEVTLLKPRLPDAPPILRKLIDTVTDKQENMDQQINK